MLVGWYYFKCGLFSFSYVIMLWQIFFLTSKPFLYVSFFHCNVLYNILKLFHHNKPKCFDRPKWYIFRLSCFIKQLGTRRWTIFLSKFRLQWNVNSRNFPWYENSIFKQFYWHLGLVFTLINTHSWVIQLTGSLTSLTHTNVLPVWQKTHKSFTQLSNTLFYYAFIIIVVMGSSCYLYVTSAINCGYFIKLSLQLQDKSNFSFTFT